MLHFSQVEKKEIFQKLLCLDSSKAFKDTDVLTKIKENANIFKDFIHPSINASVNNGDFPLFLKLLNVIPVFFKKNAKTQEVII